MPAVFERDLDGNVREWELGEGQYPRCGAPCEREFKAERNFAGPRPVRFLRLQGGIR